MAPLFKPGDFLCVRTSVIGDIKVGDIVIVQWEDNLSPAEYVVHRVLSVTLGYLITQGDNNFFPDSQLVTNDNFIGLVVFFERQNRVFPVIGGTIGLFYANLIHFRNRIWLIIKRLGWRIYRLIRQSGVFARVWHPVICQVRLLTDKGILIKYCHKNRTVAHWWLEKKYFDVRKPFDLVISKPEELN